MRHIALVVAAMLLAISTDLAAQSEPRAGTTLPVMLTSGLNSSKVRPGERITARVMQAVSVTAGSEIPAGAKVLGHILRVETQQSETGSQLSFRFDRIVSKHREISTNLGLRAIASFMEVSDAQIPETGSDAGTSAYNATTRQVGGDIVYGAGGPVMAGATEVGRGIPGGVLARLTATPGSECAQGMTNPSEVQSLWVFSSGACGVYGFPSVTVRKSGRSAPLGEIVLTSTRKTLKVPSGTGLLLGVTGESH